MRALSGGGKEPSAEDEKSPQRRMKRALSVKKSPQRIFRAISNFLSNRLLAGPLNLSSQVLVERLPHHCRIVWIIGQGKRHG